MNHWLVQKVTAKNTASVWSHCERRRDGASSFPAIHRLKQTFVRPPCALRLPAVTGYEHPLGISPTVSIPWDTNLVSFTGRLEVRVLKVPPVISQLWNRCLYLLLPGMCLDGRLENFLMISCSCSVVARGLCPSLWPQKDRRLFQRGCFLSFPKMNFFSAPVLVKLCITCDNSF